jgi:acetyl esterase/lipase
LLLIKVNTLNAQTRDSVKIYLWPEGAPLAQGTDELDKPSITVYFPEKEKATNAAVLICPGGGYVTLALGHEGWQVAKWYNERGITAAILRYRYGTWDHKKYQHPAPFLDVSRAMRTLRSKSKEWNLNPEKIGVMGFSAGGHLASCLGTMHDGGNPLAKNSIDKISSKPNFMVLVYPVITFRTKHAFTFGRGVLLGENASQSLIDSMSTETRVSTQTPPTFLMYTDEDNINAMNGVLFYTALKENNVPAELHIYERGKHGYGMYPELNSIKDWTQRLENWLRNRGGLLK